MSNSAQNLNYPSIWITSREEMPDVCIQCGMFSDYCIKVKHSETSVRQVTSKTDSSGELALGCVLALLGPIGMILHGIISGARGKNTGTVDQKVTQKGKVKVPCCRLCAGQTVPQPEDSRVAAGQYLFQVHPRFAERLQDLRTRATDLKQ